MGFLVRNKKNNTPSDTVNISNTKIISHNKTNDFKWKDATKKEKKEIIIDAYKDFAF